MLVDYGLSALIDSSFSMTAAAPIHPTIRWMAPEQVDNYGQVTSQADVWAFGMAVLVCIQNNPIYVDPPFYLYGYRNCSPASLPTMTFVIHGALYSTF